MLPPATPRKRRKEARPTELTAAALALFVEKGFSATRLEDVASRAGVSKGTLYLYFDSKEALFKAVIQEGILPVVVENEAIAAKHTGSSFDLLEKLLDNWWGKIGLTDFAGIPKLMVAEARNLLDRNRFAAVITDMRLPDGTGLDLLKEIQAQRHYMAGCSNGGRHGMVAASRQGQRYDGILASAPGFNLPKASTTACPGKCGAATPARSSRPCPPTSAT